MKSFVLSLVLLLAIGFAGSAPASAAISDDARETARRDRAATYQDSGTHLNRQRLARATTNDCDSWGYRSDSRRYSETYTQKRRYAKRSTVRTAKYGKRKQYAHGKGNKHYANRQGNLLGFDHTGRGHTTMERWDEVRERDGAGPEATDRVRT